MGKIKRLRIRTRRYLLSTGRSPGAYVIREGALEPRISIHSFTESTYSVHQFRNHEQIEEHVNAYPQHTHWIDIKGLGDSGLLTYIQEKYDIHRLVIEDIVNTHQRPKLDEYDHYLFATSRSLCVTKEEELENEQIAFIVTEKVIFSFQENYEDCLDPVRHRLADSRSKARFRDTSYMLYSLMDVTLDNYFTLMYRLGEELDTLEELAFRRAGKDIIYEIQQVKKILILIRRIAWPERDKLNDMMRSATPLISQDTKTFLKDSYDHCMQVIDLVESYKDITTSVIDINLSFQSNRMNEIMKVLTVISSIFIPLTFIAGVYGMNFSYRDPKTGHILQHNMPELYAKNGYVYTLLAMFLIAVLQMVWFWRKGWLKQ